MITEDIETLDFKNLSEIDKLQYQAILLRNIQKLILQLWNSGDTKLSSILSITTALARSSPMHLDEICGFSIKVFEQHQLQQEMIKRLNEESLSTMQTSQSTTSTESDEELKKDDPEDKEFVN